MTTLIWATVLPVLVVGAVSSTLSYFRMKEVLVEKSKTLALLTGRMMAHRLEAIHDDLNSHIHVIERPGADDEDIQLVLDGIVDEYDEIDSALLTDASGIVTCMAPNDPDALGADMSGREFYRQIVTAGAKSYWSPRFVSTQWLRPSSSLSIPARGGVLTVYFDLSSLVADVQAIQAGEGATLAIVDQRATYLAHSDRRKVRVSTRDPLYGRLRRADRGEPTERTVELDGVPVIAHVYPIRDTGWATIVYQPVRPLQARLIRMVLALGAATLGIVGAAVFVFSRHIRAMLRSTGRLLAGAGQIAEGHYAPIAGTETFDEFAELAERFNTMAGAIDSRERSLRESEQRFRTVIEQAGDAMYLADPDGRVLDVNVQACVSLGYTREELLGMHVSDVDVLLPRDRIATDLMPALRSHGSVTVEGRHRRKDGTTFPVEVRCCLIELDGAPRVLALARDITERRQLEEQLRHAQKMDAIGQLAGGVAHDFNNQLTGILGYAELLAASLPEGELRDDALAIATAARRSADLTQQLLAFARKGKVLAATVDLHEIIGEVVALLQRSIDKRITVAQDLRAEPSTTTGDPTQLQNALLNIAINARDAMPDGGTLTLGTEVVTLDAADCQRSPHEIRPGRYIVVSVRDAGVGMDDDTRQRIFEPFFTTKALGQGTGMGMAAVYGTARSHHGAVEVESEPGAGTTVRLYLPIRAAVEPAEPPPAPPAARAGRPARILVADDEASVRQLATRMLERLGHEVIVCADGAEAVERFRREHDSIDLVILDLVMPNLAGGDTFLAMRKIDPDIRALLSSGYSIDGAAQAVLDQGAMGFLQKPFRLNDLAAKVEELLR